jgi:hypothetical protein
MRALGLGLSFARQRGYTIIAALLGNFLVDGSDALVDGTDPLVDS